MPRPHASRIGLHAGQRLIVPEQQLLIFLQRLFGAFLSDADTGIALAAVLRGNDLDREELAYLFREAGYDAGTLPGLDLGRGLAAFEAAFLAAASGEPALQDTIQTGQLLAQTRLQRDLLAAMYKLVDFLREAQFGSVGIEAGRIIAHNVVRGVQIVYPWQPVDLPMPASDWEGHYLRTLISRCDPLDLPDIDPTHPADADPVRISDVFTALYLEGVRRTGEQTVEAALQEFFNTKGDPEQAKGRPSDGRRA